jgi:hypothetical protein
VTRILRDGRGNEWACEEVGIGIRDEIPPEGTSVGEEFVILACRQRGSDAVGFRHIRAACCADLDSPAVQRELLVQLLAPVDLLDSVD